MIDYMVEYILSLGTRRIWDTEVLDETLSGKFKPLENDNKARFELSVAILDGDTPVAEFEGVFYVLPPSKNEEE